MHIPHLANRDFMELNDIPQQMRTAIVPREMEKGFTKNYEI
jgi:hypothetical protein